MRSPEQGQSTTQSSARCAAARCQSLVVIADQNDSTTSRVVTRGRLLVGCAAPAETRCRVDTAASDGGGHPSRSLAPDIWSPDGDEAAVGGLGFVGDLEFCLAQRLVRGPDAGLPLCRVGRRASMQVDRRP